MQIKGVKFSSYFQGQVIIFNLAIQAPELLSCSIQFPHIKNKLVTGTSY